jgi:N-acetylmuramoyl-L-alanine amidase
MRLTGLLLTAISLVFSVVAALSAPSPVALDMRVAGDDSVTRIVIEFDRPIEVSHQLLDRPWRLVLDFNKIGYGFSKDAAGDSGLVSGLRYGDMGGNHSRIIFQTRQPFKVRTIGTRHDEQNGRYNLVIDLEVTGQDDFAAALDRSITTSAVVNTAQKRDRLGVAREKDRPFTIVIDPGHGGIDNGARGVSGTQEKDVTLAFAKTLRDALSRYEGRRSS